jgi:hypothetical protein
MARHAIDAARLAKESEVDERPITVRIPIDDPYADPKASLLHHVAQNGRCRSVYYPQVALASVVGFASDVAAVELMFTSLLVQAQTALVGAATTAPPGAHTRSRAFRSSFFRSYAARIGTRLAEINEEVLAEAETEHGAALVPVLEAREQVVEDAFNGQYPDLTRSRWSGTLDSHGWASGRQAADLAKLSAAELQG